ncbi:predicted protein [Nematostella vectensis]|uniref:Prolyl 4-hydroxylase alpha subunit Fe(2+) 2OG dioxygenase domain-containing protein n=1 Tax=Nematostella vectensis TaxID=45351 RepID=A7RUA0_NEMVE|nr:uncharacterized protein LOC5517010 [Nematostella vectensis]EDO45046.1 predicted protein [Nematostella vectensis]|eukprot:XP_001637109.1 predicted protein [Nematostella vectensis]
MATVYGVFCVLLVIAVFSQAQDDDVWAHEQGLNSGNAFGIAQPEIQVIPLDVNLTSNIKFRYVTTAGQKAFVLDDVINRTTLEILKGYTMMELGAWKFSLFEPYEGGQEEPSDNIPWVNNLDCVEFANSAAGRLLQKAVMDALGTPEMYYPCKVQAKIMRRGDYTKLHTDALKDDYEYSMMMFLNFDWDKNGYGEIYLYDEDMEIFAGATPKFGRVILWPSHIPYLPRPPSIANQKGELLLHVQFSKVLGKAYKCHEAWLAVRDERIANINGPFVSTGKPSPSSIDFDSKKVAEYQSSEGKKIFVFDDLYDKEDLDNLRAHILKYGVYYFDDSDDNESDNVQWIAGFNIDNYLKSRFWNITHRVATHVSGSNKWFPYDISCNLIRYADHTRIHHDCNQNEDEWTHLIYLNPDMEKNDYGETVYYERNSDNTEIIAEVRPKYGRAVIFQGIIPHSARPPSTNYSKARLSFVTKMSVDEIVGRTKAFKEEMRHFSGVQEQLQTVKASEDGQAISRRSRERRSKYASTEEQTNGEESQEEAEEPEDDAPDDDDAPDVEGNGSQESPSVQPPEMESEEEDEQDSDDPEINMLTEKLRNAKSVEEVRAVHQELVSRHANNREVIRTAFSKFL